MVRVFRITHNPVFKRRTEKSVLLFIRLKSTKKGGGVEHLMQGLEIVMDIESLEIYEIIDHYEKEKVATIINNKLYNLLFFFLSTKKHF